MKLIDYQIINLKLIIILLNFNKNLNSLFNLNLLVSLTYLKKFNLIVLFTLFIELIKTFLNFKLILAILSLKFDLNSFYFLLLSSYFSFSYDSNYYNLVQLSTKLVLQALFHRLNKRFNGNSLFTSITFIFVIIIVRSQHNGLLIPYLSFNILTYTLLPYLYNYYSKFKLNYSGPWDVKSPVLSNKNLFD